MKSSLFGVGVAAMVIMTSVMNTVGIAKAQLQKTQPNLNIPANSIHIPRNIKLLPSVSGNLEIVRGQYGYKVQCKDVKVYLISQEYIEEPATSTKPGEINLGSPKKPIFKYQGIVKSDNTKDNSGSTTYCKYSVLPEAKYVAKKAILVFDSGSTCPGPNEIITILDTNVQKNSKQFICSIG